MIRSFAPAKLNLYLHITGKRSDGYHLLDSLVAFCGVGDEVKIEPAQDFQFITEGPMSLALLEEPVEGNLAFRAAKLMAETFDRPLDFKMTLVKNLPIASGIGGGSADAAAALRVVAKHWGVAQDDARLFDLAKKLGQDVACCVKNETCYFVGIGDTLETGPELPHTDIVLVNPNKALSTAASFKARQGEFTPKAQFETAPADVNELVAMLQYRKNDLTDGSCGILPDVNRVLSALENTQDCLLHRMSGSGATCFGIYPNRSASRAAAAQLFNNHPGWWVVATSLPYKNGP